MTDLPRIALTDEGAANPPSPQRSTNDLAAFLHNRDLLGQKWAREGIEQLKRGELIERPTDAQEHH